MTINIKHKHASHFIIIESQAFKANDKGQWDLTDIWRTLELPKGKQPGKWVDTKKAKTLEQTGNIGSLNKGRAGSVTQATKRATLAYAGWVSDEFEAMVYDAFEAILEMPEVALLVADKMRSLGNDHSAAILERTTENQDRNSILRGLNRSRKPRTLSPAEKATRAAVGVAKRHEKANPIR
ncbi:hypothetical protein ALP73_00295 [Pseudomonas coronafaciens pv. garcae]|uniref:KilA N-terminal/APSES-type HTH DNA-binding domain-containing protein n=2 Tax=Pseudomonas syringae group TaxID=136849 RepID=A0AB37QS28_9PSED|nr:MULTISPECIES: hypothetical protein [Pseudomonas syringae group]RMR99535.1 hypothetical protein ALP73_00295 [Pseudomonas coronafaciens pv. garcae]RMS02449.1 hypothetical protein ALP74_02255 [Pseudomonas coronafaciens pv. garcae]RMS27162.1 hypothetical protein ALP71_03057 [Pseudomonas coronafaciens pv. garcae]